MKKRFLCEKREGGRGGCIFREENHLYISFRKVSALAFSVILKKNFSGFLPVFVHLGDELVYCAIFFFRAKILYELYAHFFVVDILREIEDVYLDTYIVAIIDSRAVSYVQHSCPFFPSTYTYTA